MSITLADIWLVFAIWAGIEFAWGWFWRKDIGEAAQRIRAWASFCVGLSLVAWVAG